MKKIITFSIFTSAVILGLTSCKKDFTCTCFDGTNTATGKQVYSQVTKKVAQDKCDVFNGGAAATGGYCSLSSD